MLFENRDERIPYVTYLPEVLNHGILFVVASVIGVLHPVVNVDFRDTTNEQFKLPLVKDVDEIGRDELVEALDEGVELLLDTLLNAPLCYESGKRWSVRGKNRR